MWTEAILAGVGWYLLSKRSTASESDLVASPSKPPSTPIPSATPTLATAGTPASSLAGGVASTASQLATTATNALTTAIATKTTPATIVPTATQASTTLKVSTTPSGTVASTLAVAPTKPAGWWTAPDPGVAGLTPAAIGSHIASYRDKWLMWIRTGAKIAPPSTAYPFSSEAISGKLSKDETIKAEKAARDAFEIAYNEMMGRTLAPAVGSTRLGVK